MFLETNGELIFKSNTARPVMKFFFPTWVGIWHLGTMLKLLKDIGKVCSQCPLLGQVSSPSLLDLL